jgi:RNA polymerase sigma-70 factor (ECF subfamily)
MTLEAATDLQREFVPLFAAIAQRLYGYIYTQLGHASDTDDVFQETSRVLWEKFPQFTLGTNFYAWACRIAEFQVLAFRQRRNRSRLTFSDEFVRVVAAQAAEDSELLLEQHRALSNCIAKLKERDRELLLLRYSHGATTKSVAERVGKTLDAVYKALNRIQDKLLECTHQALVRQN